jgi:hypothetical protein
MRVDLKRDPGRGYRAFPVFGGSHLDRENPMKRLCMILLPLLAGPTLAATPQSLETADITLLAVAGQASMIEVTSDPTRPYRAALSARRSGWFSRWSSIWFYNECRNHSSLRLEKAVLTVDIQESSGFGSDDCMVELKANLPPSTDVTIIQKAAQVVLTGRYGNVSLDLTAGDVTLRGDAKTLSVAGEAVRANLSVTAVEKVAVDVTMLDLYLGFAPGTAISYRVDAVASLVDSALPDTPGAKPSVLVRTRHGRVTIR